MDEIYFNILIFGALASIFGVLLFWFLQLVFIETQKYFLSRVNKKHDRLCKFTNFLGIFFQTICHALGYTVTKSGISSFYIDVHYGKVEPKKQKKGVFEWLSNGFLFIGPFFIPAFLLLICLFFLTDIGMEIAFFSGLEKYNYTFSQQLIKFGQNLYIFSKSFFGFLFNLDLFNPAHLGFTLLLIFLGMGIRPSYLGHKRKQKVDIFFDLKNIWQHIKEKPLYFLSIFFIFYLLFYISFFMGNNWYVKILSVFGWISIISITSSIIAIIILFLIEATDQMPSFFKAFSFLTIFISYIISRVIFYFILKNYSDLTNSISLLVMVLSTFFVTIFLLKKNQ
ncbi:MAG: hypothetical protein V5A68_05755 [Candidatus Thermoplasmatota archaeon]